MEAQRKRARDTVKSNAEHTLSTEGWVELRSLSATEFVGYNSDQAEVRIGRYKITKPVDDSNLFSEGLVVFDKTPFYAEMGGQVGDTGILTAKNGLTLEVNDTIKLNDITVHKVTSKAEAFPVDQLSQPFTARIKSRERACTQRNHSATHLLQSALKKVLGNHISQSGSRVSHESLRFDFTHFKALENDEIRRVEEMVNEWILEDFPLSTEIKATDEAKKEGAIALFGEKYGENVRVVSMGDVSKELCGGTHVHSTGNIGLFHIISESSIAAGVRRIEAVTGMECLRLIHEKEAIVSQLTSLLKINEKNIFKRVTDTLAKVKALEAENTKLSQAQTGETVEKLIKIADTSAGGSFPWVAENIGSIDKKKFTDLTDRISDTIREKKLETIVIFLAADVNSKALFSASAGKTVVKQYGIHCGELVKAAAIKAGGGGGGSPVRAQAGGNNLNKIQDAIDAAVSIIQEKAGIS